jgi:hypothetical protein
MYARTLFLGGLLLALLALFVRAAPTIDQGKRSNNPLGVFLTAKDASKKKDYKTLLACYTEDSQKLMTEQYILLGAMFKHVSPHEKGKAMELAKLMDEIFRKHGLTDKAVANARPTNTTTKEGVQKIRQVADLVKSRSGYWIDYFGALEKIGHEPYQPFADAELADLKTEPNKARGMVVTKSGNTQKKYPIEFVRVGGRWKILVPDPKPAAPPKALPRTK